MLLRADLNVPMKEGAVADTTRLDRLAPTVREICDKGASAIVLSHFGRPKGKRLDELSLRPLVGPLSRALGGREVAFAEDCIGPVAERAAEGLRPGEVLLLENLRFHAGEEANDPAFARSLAALGEIYVNDAFSAAHRAHASTEGLAHLLPAAAGRSMEAELEALASALETPAPPLAAIVGGAKISTKLDLLGNLLDRVDTLAIGGAMANTFLHALGTDVGASLCEVGMADTARAILADADAAGCEIVLPSDVVVARGAGSGSACGNGAHRRGAGRCHDPRHRRGLGERALRAARGMPHAGLERPARRLRGAAVRCGDGRGRKGRGATHQGGIAAHRGRRRRYRRRARPCRRRGGFQLSLHRRGAFLEWLEGKTLPGVAALGG